MRPYKPFKRMLWLYVIMLGGMFFLLCPHTALANSLPQSVPPLSPDALRNATYTVSEVANPVTLKDGLYTDPAVPLNVALTDVQANGDLNGDDAADAVVILNTNLGGTADLVDLAVVLNEDGTAKSIATAFLGDSIHVESLAITNQQIVVSMLVMGPDDAQCCPTQTATATYILVGDQLVRKPTKAFGRLLAFPQGKRYGYVNVLGEFAIEPQFVVANEFSEGLASVSVDGQTTGFINRLGEMVIAPQFVYAGKFVQGLANVGLPNPDADQPFVVAYIDRRGTWMFNGARFAAAEPFSEGLAAVSVDGKSYGYINRTGQFVIEPQFAYAEPFREGLAAVQIGEQFGYIDASGQVVIAAQYEFAKPFSEGLAVITLDRKTGYISHQGKVVIEPQFDYGHDFKEGRALVALAGQEHYIDSSGQFLAADLTFTEGQDFSQGLAAVKIEGRFGYLNLDGELVIPPTFTYAGVFDRDIALAQTDDVQGIIDPTGAWLLAVPRFSLDGTVINLSDATATQLIDYIPDLPETTHEGKCTENSRVVAGSSAWRCQVGADTYDPCLTAADGQTLVCAANPATAEPGFNLDLTAPLPAVQPAPAAASPIWLFQSGDNATCTAIAPLTAEIDGKPMTHVCSDGAVILGDVNQTGDLWQAEKVQPINDAEGHFTAGERETVAVVVAWRATQP